jgi:hypothetical protein
MKRSLPLSFLLAVLMGTAVLSAKTFEGTVTMKLSNGHEGAHDLTYSVKDGVVRTDFKVNEKMTATAIMNIAQDEMTILMPGQPMYMTMPIKRTAEKVTGQSMDDVSLENTGITEKILGYNCTKYLAKSKQGVTEIWATTELGSFMGLGAGMGGPMSRKPSPGWEKFLVGKDFFPMRVVGGEKEGNSFRLEVTSVEPKTLPASLFVPPEGYHKFDMSGMMQGMGGANPFNH